MLFVQLVGLQNGPCLFVPLLHYWLSVKLLQKCVNLIFALSSFWMLSPILHQNFFNFIVVFLEFILNLLGPHNWSCFHWYITDVADFEVLSLHVRLQEFFIKQVDTLFNSFKKLTLILFNGWFYPRPEEQSIEFGEDPEHFVGIGWASKFFPQFFGDIALSDIDLWIEEFLCLEQCFLAFFGSIKHIDSLEVIEAFLDTGSWQEVLLVWLANDVLNHSLQLEVQFSDPKELLEPALERIVVIDSLDLRSCVGDDFAETVGGGFLAHECTHAFLKLLKDVLGFLIPGLEVGEWAKHKIFLGQNFIHLVSNILTQNFNQLVNPLDVISLFGVAQLLQVGEDRDKDVAELVDWLWSHQLLELYFLEESVDVCSFLCHLLEPCNDWIEGSSQMELIFLSQNANIKFDCIWLNLILDIS